MISYKMPLRYSKKHRNHYPFKMTTINAYGNPSLKKQRKKYTKLTIKQKDELFNEFRKGEKGKVSYDYFAKKFDVSRNCVKDIIEERFWAYFDKEI